MKLNMFSSNSNSLITLFSITIGVINTLLFMENNFIPFVLCFLCLSTNNLLFWKLFFYLRTNKSYANRLKTNKKYIFYFIHFFLLTSLILLFVPTFSWFLDFVKLILLQIVFILVFELNLNLYRSNITLTTYSKQKTNEAEFKLQILREQLNPHFLFNSLNVLKSLINIDQEKAVKYTIDLADLLRITIDSDKKEASIKEELELCNRYLNIQNMRFNNNIFFNVALNLEEKKQHIPFLTLIILIENAIKHNVISGQHKLFINLTLEENYLLLRNNKNTKFQSLKRNGIGLESINYRCKLLVNKNLEILDTKEYFTVKIPIKHD